MSLVLYSTMLFYPGGGLASGAEVSIRLQGSNQPALLFTTAAGTTAADNPVTADEIGQITFWAAPGNYVTELAGETFTVPIDPSHTAPVWPDLWVHEQSTPAAVWTVNHHFGTLPWVDVVVSGATFEAEVTHSDVETTTITFGSAVSGTAYLRR